MTKSQVVSPGKIAAKLDEHWSPRVVAEVDDAFVKVAKVQGSLTWHSHDNEDELFYILKGSLRIEMEDRTVELREGDAFVGQNAQPGGAAAPGVNCRALIRVSLAEPVLTPA